MRIGFLTANDVPNVNYRAVAPADALRQQGHDVELVFQQPDHTVDVRPLRRCDVVHIYRRADPNVRACVDDLQRRGIAITWDNDDDIRLLPPESQRRTGVGGFQADRDFRDQAKVFRRADVVTTTSSQLAQRYLDAGAARVMQIENYLHREQFADGPRRHDGLVIGWVAGLEHRADAMALSITDTLNRILARHPDVRVVTIGVRLNLDPDRYTHHLRVSMTELKDHIRQFDIGIAPLADLPMSYARSNVKLKEYAAGGVPWLASDRGPYAGFGPSEGGLLVADDGWEEALDRLAGSRFQRARLRRRAEAWAKTQRLERHVERWHEVFRVAVSAASERHGGGVPAGVASDGAR